MTNIGFTGTRYGMSPEQRTRVMIEVGKRADGTVRGHHGDCVGADAEFHDIIRAFGNHELVVHPPLNDSDRAWRIGDESRPPLPYMKRNARIVSEADVMIAAPFEMDEQERGGTWRTVQLARKAGRPLVIVWRDGTTKEERL